MSAVYRNLGDGANSAQPPRLLDRMRQVLRTKHYAYSTEQTYVQWARRYILFHNKRHPQEMGGPEIEQFLTRLARTAWPFGCLDYHAKKNRNSTHVLQRGACGVQSPLDRL